MNIETPTYARHDITNIVNNQALSSGDTFRFDGWTIPRASTREIAMALKSAKTGRRNDIAEVVATLKKIGQKADWINDEDMTLISVRVGCAKSYLVDSMARLNDWLAEIDRYTNALGGENAQGYRTAEGAWSGGLTTTMVLAGDASALGPLALTHGLLAGARVIAKGSKYEPLAPCLFIRELIRHGINAPSLVFLDTSDPDSTAHLTRLIEHTQQSVVYGSDDTLKAIYGQADVSMTHKKIGFWSGRSGIVILDDADPTEAARIVLHSTAEDRGNRCYSCKKVFVPETLAEAFIEQLTAAAETLVRGEPQDIQTDIGRLHPDSRKVTQAALGTARVLYDRDVLIIETEDGHPLMVEEMPYPVCALRRYSADEDPVALFNKSSEEVKGHTALAVGVITENRERFETAAQGLNATKVIHNLSTVDIDHTKAHQGLYLFREMMRFKEIY